MTDRKLIQELLAPICRHADDCAAPAAPFATRIDGFTLVRSRRPTAVDVLAVPPAPGPER